jgi:hypothetical protein
MRCRKGRLDERHIIALDFVEAERRNMRKLLYPILAVILALVLTLTVWPVVANAEDEDPFSYTPSAYSASVT